MQAIRSWMRARHVLSSVDKVVPGMVANCSLTFRLRPGQAAMVLDNQVMQLVEGTWQTHYDDQHWGHYFCSVHDGVTHPVKEGTDRMYSSIDYRTHWMNDVEMSACLRGANADLPGVPVV
ncbi:hypothetical protein [Streptomyces sp. NPDC048309]|uniref:hypothetical protein n=1 Tax=Streptomyces sp. NPDC048309 TaxID=3154618 RepID=UPI0033D392FB